MIEDIGVWDLVKSANPVKHAIRKIWRALPVKEVSQSYALQD